MKDPVDTQSELAAGDFGSWLAGLEAALVGNRDSDVPCDGCTACCTASQFIHVGPDETDALSHIPRAVLFAAPGLPDGHRVMGYDTNGHCPMFADNACSIYEHRPRACRTYDCRVFAAAEIAIDDPSKAAVNRQAARWRFAFAGTGDRDRQRAIRDASSFLAEHPECSPGRSLDATTRAVLAAQIYDTFLGAESPTVAAVEASVNEAVARAR